MDMDLTRDADARQEYVPNKSDNWTRWRSTTEDDIPEHEVVENLLRPHKEIAESSNYMGERSVERERSEGNVPESTEEDDVRTEDAGVTAVQKGKQKMVRRS